MKLHQYLPSLEWLKNYNTTQFKGDLSAGLTVGVMLIPQGMAYAMIAGLPPVYGLYAATLPLIIYALLGTSPQLAVGPVAMVSLLTATGIATIAGSDLTTYIQLAITLALLVGLIQFLLGIFRLGFLVNFLSHPVISGFTSAAALIIGLSQLKHLLGIDLARSHHIHEIIGEALLKIGEVHIPTLLIGLGGVGLLVGIKKINKAIPGALLAVVLGIVAVKFLGLAEQGVKIVGEVPQGLPAFSMPTWSWDSIQSLLPIAVAISLVSFMESIAVAKAIQAKHKDYKIRPNQELIALGMANIGGSFLQSYPVTGGFSRTAVNEEAGAKTGMASIISAFLIILTLLFLTPLFYYLPKAILASLIMVAVFGLIDIQEARYLWKADRSDFWMLVATFLATLLLGIELGIGIGVLLSLAMIIFQTTRPHIAELGKIPNTNLYRNVDRFEQLEQRSDILIIRFDAQLYFANITYFQEAIEQLVLSKGTKLQTIILNFEGVNNMDSTAIHALEDLVKEYRSQGLKVLFTDVKGPVRDAMEKADLTKKIGKENCFFNIAKAIEYLDKKKESTLDPSLKEYTLQTNVG